MLVVAYGGSRRLLRQGLIFVALACALGGGVVAIGLLDGRSLSLGSGVFYSSLDLKMVLLSAAVCYVVLTAVFQRIGRHNSLTGELLQAKLRLGKRTAEFTALPPVQMQPMLLWKDGAPTDFTYRDIRQYGGYLRAEPCESFSALLDRFYTETDQAERMRQRSQTLRKAISNLHERTRRKLELQRQELEEIFSLPPADRAVIHLFYYEGLSTGEIARLTGQAEGTVRSRLSRARSRLRRLLKGETK